MILWRLPHERYTCFLLFAQNSCYCQVFQLTLFPLGMKIIQCLSELPFLKKLCCLFWVVLGLPCCMDCSVAAVLGLLTAAASCCSGWTPGHLGFSSLARGLSCCRAQALEHRLSSCGTWTYSVVCGIFSHKGLNPCLLHWQVNFLPLSQQRDSYWNYL